MQGYRFNAALLRCARGKATYTVSTNFQLFCQLNFRQSSREVGVVENNFKLAFADSAKGLDNNFLSKLTDLTSLTGKP